MPVYVVIDVVIKDQEKFQRYVVGHLPTIAQYGGTIICRAFDPAVIIGDWSPQLLVIHQWPDREQFFKWLDSDEYRPWKELRMDACDMNMVLT
jgi:uncharacterized protein (DUF1330 family)